MSHQVDTAPMDQLLRYLWENNATDLHLCAGTPPRVRIDGKLFAIPGSEPLSIDFLDAVLTGLLSEEDADVLPEEVEELSELELEAGSGLTVMVSALLATAQSLYTTTA